MQRVVGEMYWLILTDTFLRTEDKQKGIYCFILCTNIFLKIKVKSAGGTGMKLNSYSIQNSNN